MIPWASQKGMNMTPMLSLLHQTPCTNDYPHTLSPDQLNFIWNHRQVRCYLHVTLLWLECKWAISFAGVVAGRTCPKDQTSSSASWSQTSPTEKGPVKWCSTHWNKGANGISSEGPAQGLQQVPSKVFFCRIWRSAREDKQRLLGPWYVAKKYQFIANWVEQTAKKDSTTSMKDSRKENSRFYYLPVNGESRCIRRVLFKNFASATVKCG